MSKDNIVNTVDIYNCGYSCEALYVNGNFVKCFSSMPNKKELLEAIGVKYRWLNLPENLGEDVVRSGTDNYRPPATVEEIEKVAKEREIEDIFRTIERLQARLNNLRSNA